MKRPNVQIAPHMCEHDASVRGDLLKRREQRTCGMKKLQSNHEIVSVWILDSIEAGLAHFREKVWAKSSRSPLKLGWAAWSLGDKKTALEKTFIRLAPGLEVAETVFQHPKQSTFGEVNTYFKLF